MLSGEIQKRWTKHTPQSFNTHQNPLLSPDLVPCLIYLNCLNTGRELTFAIPISASNGWSSDFKLRPSILCASNEPAIDASNPRPRIHAATCAGGESSVIEMVTEAICLLSWVKSRSKKEK
ncbi:hypothetical protein BCR33DRAFT_393122 [Rhizoclosmatium globosum]|uniref:Uncharacterized protein n=1 Tax=Rhizoclosmatium globosum TaxID=329046 RepID=A0A1Y2BYA3_9FUNG|nr:hypothetical protein BCR33DRAFT_393122 [Rhizoclosmatium globosum]|eukprot:ORY39644.1 hypothetical protein BCR33DRAFT_393122 [Rhizoclosmatium globosum]